MPDTTAENAFIACERFRLMIEGNEIKLDNAIDEIISVTVSIGLSLGQGTELNLEELFKKSDISLYQAKNNGRNQIKLYEELSCEDENSSEAYLYILFEFEMIDTLREVLDATSDKDFKAFRALLDLKDNSKHYTLETISYNI